jgi:periplasmic protein TonB
MVIKSDGDYLGFSMEKLLLLSFLVTLSLRGFSQVVERDTIDNDQVYIVEEEMARFQGGDIYTFRKWAMQHLKYPESARRMGVQGRVIVQFIVSEEGNVENVKVFRSLDPACDEEAVKVIRNSPKWQPGKSKGKFVKQQFVMSIIFKLGK